MSVIFFRTAVFYILTVLSLRVLGKRQIGELELSELVVMIMISELATLPLQDPDMPFLYAVLSMITIVLLEVFISWLVVKSTFFKNILSGKYSILIDKGKINYKEMQKAQITAEELSEELRLHGALDMSEVKFCILETSGKMSIILNKNTTRSEIPVPVVIDGKYVKENIKTAGLNKEKISKILTDRGLKSVEDVFLLTVSVDGVTVVPK